MEDSSPRVSNPFDDPTGSEFSRDGALVLTVDHNATLTIGTEALIVVDEGMRQKKSAASSCGILPQSAKPTRAIPFHNVLWAELNAIFAVTIYYAEPVGRKGKSCRPRKISYNLMDTHVHQAAKLWVEKLMERAYPPNTKRRKRIKVLVNPFGGKGNAQMLWLKEVEPIFTAAHCVIDVEMTKYKGHAIHIAEKMDIDAFDVVACASGDGLPHEVFNGLAKRQDARRALRKIAVCQIPCGSGNAMCWNLCGTSSAARAAVEITKGIRTPLDLMAITQGSERFYSCLSQTIGIIAEADLGTETLRWMGDFRFTWGVIVRILGKITYPAELSVLVDLDDKPAIRRAYRLAREEHEAAKDKQMQQHESDEGNALEEEGQELPALQYGTVKDALPSGFVTEDRSNLGNFYVGKMCIMTTDGPFFPAALPSDGKMDMLAIAGDLPRLKAARMMLSLEDGGLMDFHESSYRKVLAYRISPRVNGVPSKRRFRSLFGEFLGAKAGHERAISIDGEKVPFEPFQVEVVPKLGTVLSKTGMYEYAGPKPM